MTATPRPAVRLPLRLPPTVRGACAAVQTVAPLPEPVAPAPEPEAPLAEVLATEAAALAEVADPAAWRLPAGSGAPATSSRPSTACSGTIPSTRRR